MSDTRTHTGPTSAGRVLGSYRILHELSTGGMGTVFRAQHVLLGRPAAVKLLRRDLTESAELVQRFVNEAKAVTACKHPGIVEVYDFGYTPDGHAFIVMELLEGESLGRRLARLRFTELEAAAIAHGIASALKAAHRVGVIHRDLKPDNVFLVPDPDGGVDRTKVLDFGIAKLADGAPATGHNTQTGALIGTPLYMAPEQARAAAAIDQRADLYSLGCILYHMVVGRPPFLADGAGEIIALQMFEPPVPPSRLAPVTPEMDRLVLRLLEKDPAARFGSAGEVATALARLDRRPTSRMTRPSVVVGSDTAPTLPGDVELGAHEPRPAAAPPAGEPPLAVALRKRSAMPLLAALLGGLALAALGIGYAMRRGGGPAALPGTAPVQRPAATPPPPPLGPVATPDPVPAPAGGPAVATPPPSMPEPPVDRRAASPDPRASRVAPGPRKPARPRTERGVGAITGPADPRLQDRAIEVHRDSPRPGDHTEDGAPIETTLDNDSKQTPHGGEAQRVPPPSPSPKDGP